MKDSNDQDKPLPRTIHTKHIWLIARALVCVLFGEFTAWGVRALWQLDDTPMTSTFNEQMMHRKTRTMEQILDGLVRGDLRRVENSAEHMKSIGLHVNSYSSSEVHENNNELFRHNSVDSVVMGTVGRSGLTGLLMGNTSEEVLDQINCSVLAVKPYSFKTLIHV